MSEWTQASPTVPGWYWVLTEDGPCYGTPHVVRVEHDVFRDEMRAWVPFMDFSEPLTDAPWVDAHWSGPLPTPCTPTAAPDALASPSAAAP